MVSDFWTLLYVCQSKTLSWRGKHLRQLTRNQVNLFSHICQGTAISELSLMTSSEINWYLEYMMKLSMLVCSESKIFLWTQLLAVASCTSSQKKTTKHCVEKRRYSLSSSHNVLIVVGTTQLTEINALLLTSTAMPVAKEIISPDATGQSHSLDRSGQHQLLQTSRRRGYTHRINKVEIPESSQSTDFLYCENVDWGKIQCATTHSCASCWPNSSDWLLQ